MRIGSSRLSLLGVLLALSSPHALGGIRYVDAQLATGANDGSSWSSAFQGSDGVRAALAVALPGDQIWVARGIYLPDPLGDRHASLRLASGVELFGGFAGGETQLAQRDPLANPAILSGDLAGDDAGAAYDDNSFHVVRATGSGGSGTLDGFTVRGGHAFGGGTDLEDWYGGGIHVTAGASPLVRDCIVSGNQAASRGAGAWAEGSSPRFVRVRFVHNEGVFIGGGVSLSGCIAPRFESCEFRSNSAGSGGGAEVESTPDVVFSGCVFFDNQALYAGSGAGGGALRATSAPVLLTNCTIAGNRTLSVPVAGILANPSCSIENTIVYFNTGPGGAQGSSNNASGVSARYSCVQGGISGTAMLSVDPGFRDLALGDLRLVETSPCADAGENSSLPTSETKDLAGEARRADAPAVPDTGAGGLPIVDMGAFEVQNTLYSPFCAGDGTLATACPCGNTGSQGHGCASSDFFSPGGFLLASGVATPDSVVLNASDIYPSGTCVFLQGDQQLTAGAVFGDGVRCVGGVLKRLYVKSASSAGVSAPAGADLSISARSAALGDTINAGELRYYQVYYRDPDPTFCPSPAGNTWNVTAGVILQW